jgi:hypothetical protein
MPTRVDALDLAHARHVLRLLEFSRGGPQPQTITLRRSGEPDTDWPATQAAAEERRRRKKGRRAYTWSGFLGGVPAWSVHGQVLVGPRQTPRIRTRYEIWALGPGGLALHAVAEDPGHRGRRWLQTRAAQILTALRGYQVGRERDPFRAIRTSDDGEHWRERYRFVLPSRKWVELEGPAPATLPPLPTTTLGRRLFGEFPQDRTEEGSPDPQVRALVPGYMVRCGPGPLAGQEERWLAGVLGVDAGVVASEEVAGTVGTGTSGRRR